MVILIHFFFHFSLDRQDSDSFIDLIQISYQANRKRVKELNMLKVDRACILLD